MPSGGTRKLVAIVVIVAGCAAPFGVEEVRRILLLRESRLREGRDACRPRGTAS